MQWDVHYLRPDSDSLSLSEEISVRKKQLPDCFLGFIKPN